MYAPLATDEEIRAAHDTDIEPWHHPHHSLSLAPMAAEPATHYCGDEGEQAETREILPWLTLRRFVAFYAAAIAGLPLLIHAWRSGWFQ